ncbi:tol-pal system-associated acyl-CoA thioesterase [Alkalilimnicola sp. S0819]|uniref:tol-pal system-associated acyl-CoA thioesterase n=1 Tax=Alkalilimnicola sp. S0819 TaxID=2613922 RepID=UPI0039B06B46
MTAVREFSLSVRVYYEDTDVGGIVYHANYLKYMERARTDWLRALGFEQSRLRDTLGIVFAVRGMGIEFRRPARFDDMLQVQARLAEAKRASLRFAQSIHRGGERLLDAEVRIACLDARTLRPRALPAPLLAALN